MKGAVLVTGSTGMIGRALCERLVADGNAVVTAGRTRSNDFAWSAGDPLTESLTSVDAVVHLAARVHVRGTGFHDHATFEAVNTRATLQLAQEAARQGVRRFVFMSSIGVLGGVSNQPLREDAVPAPHTPYAVSKWRAEQLLGALPGIETVILRPPAVIGPHARGNLQSIVNALRRGLPLPFASIRNARQFITLNNLVDAIVLALSGDVVDETFHVANSEKVSTPQLCRELAELLGTTPRLVPFPPSLLRGGLSLLGRQSIGAGLTQNLLIDSTRIHDALDWQPRESLREGLQNMIGMEK